MRRKHPATRGPAHRTDGRVRNGTSAHAGRTSFGAGRSRGGNVTSPAQASVREGTSMSDPSAALPRSAGAPSSGGRAAIADRQVRRRRARPRRRLLRRGEARSDAAVHGLGVCDLASRRARHRARSTCGACAGGPASSSASCVVNGELLLGDNGAAARKPDRPAGRQHGRDHRRGDAAPRLIGPRAALDRVEQVGGMLLALGTATAISATVGTVSMLAGGVIDAVRGVRSSGARGGSATPRAGLSSCR